MSFNVLDVLSTEQRLLASTISSINQVSLLSVSLFLLQGISNSSISLHHVKSFINNLAFVILDVGHHYLVI